MNPTGGNTAPNYPYFITTEPLVVKKILVPKETKLIYEEHAFKKGKQDKIMSEEKLNTIDLPVGETIDWGGVPIISIHKFFNSEMRGFTVSANFNQMRKDKKTKFSELWNSCSSNLGITVQTINDWSFNKKNISNIESCSVNYQRYFKDNAEQQKFLDSMLAELIKDGDTPILLGTNFY